MANNDTTPCIHPHDLPSIKDGTTQQRRFAYAIRRKAVRCINEALEAGLAHDDAERVADLLTRCLCEAPQARHSLWWIDGCFGDADEFADRVIRACLSSPDDGSPASLIDSFDSPNRLF